ncbi:MAG: sterol desaturase family protein [Bdellovibrionaceae bacterium]|nr:sterol desaturase family protein [Pseudobdellovibrionaceae bacterium]
MGRFFHYAIYPLFIISFVVPMLVMYDRLSPAELRHLSLALISGCVLAAFLLEFFLPFDQNFRMFSGQFLWDSYFTFIQLPLVSIAIEWIGNVLKTQQIPTLGFLWPHHLNPIAQMFMILVIAELFYFVYHFVSHKSDLLWSIHKYHHQYATVYWNNSATFHAIDITLSAFFYFLPLLMFSVSPYVQYLFVTLSGVTGILIHVNFRHSTRFINKIFNTSELHRWHHQPEAMSKNFGKVLCIWDWIFNTRYERDNKYILKANHAISQAK